MYAAERRAGANAESEVEIGDLILKWASNHDKDISDLIKEAGADGSQIYKSNQDILRSFGLNATVYTYCTEGKNFSADNFRKQMQELGMNPLCTNKVLYILQSWRNHAKAEALSELKKIL